MKAVLTWAAFMLALYVLQSSLLPLIAFYGVSADLMLLMVVSFSFLRGYKQGALFGFMAGLLQDLATGTFFGVNIFAKMIIGCGCGYFSRRLFKEQMMLPLMAVVAATGLQYLILLIFSWLLGYPVELLSHWRRSLAPMLVQNIVFALPVHIGVSRLSEWLKTKS